MSDFFKTHSLGLKAPTALEIDSGEITVVQGFHIVQAESGTTDDLDTITVGYDTVTVNSVTYRPMVILQADSGDTITLKHEVDNISLANGKNFDLEGDKLIILQYDGTYWRDLQSTGAADNLPTGATIAVGGEAGNVINVTVQLTDHNGNDLAQRAGVHFYLADDANGDTPSGTAPDGGIAIGTDGAMIEWTANLSGLLVSESDGDIDINLTESGAATWYLIIVLPTGGLTASAAITFA